MSFNVIGISAYFHDSACCVMRDGKVVAAAQEERFTRRKHDPIIPKLALRYCLKEAGLTIKDIDLLAYYENPQQKLARQLWMMQPGIPRDLDTLIRFDPSRPEREIRQLLGYEGQIHFAQHHTAHAASSFYFSGFDEAAIFTADGVGEWATTTYGAADSKGIQIFEQVDFPDSLGLLYSSITSYLGFSVNDGEYKVMGLAPYGKPQYVDRIWKMIELLPQGQFKLDLKYFDFQSRDRMYSDEVANLFEAPPRRPESDISQFHEDVACSLQRALEEILIEKIAYLRTKVDTDALCMAGGVALNCVANRAIQKSGSFRRVFIQPAAGDAGTALGAAALGHAIARGPAELKSRIQHMYLGPEYSSSEILNVIRAAGLDALDFRGDEAGLLAATVDRITDSKVIGWFQGKMEFGPRALGSRSILADPRDESMRDRINASVKKREAFRPFAPAVLESCAREHFDLDHESPFMLETCQVISTIDLPAITHVDRSARVQTVNLQSSPRFARLLKSFGERTGCPILLNTSFNMRDEPIVCSPVDALVCFFRSEIDALVIGDFIIDRTSAAVARQDFFRSVAPLPTSAITHRIYTLI